MAIDDVRPIHCSLHHDRKDRPRRDGGVYRAEETNLSNEVAIEDPAGIRRDFQAVSSDILDFERSPDGRRLFYRNGSNRVMVMDITTDPEFSAGPPRVLQEGPILGGSRRYRSYDISPEGDRFIAVGKTSEPIQLNVVTNWFEALKRLVPLVPKDK